MPHIHLICRSLSCNKQKKHLWKVSFDASIAVHKRKLIRYKHRLRVLHIKAQLDPLKNLIIRVDGTSLDMSLPYVPPIEIWPSS